MKKIVSCLILIILCGLVAQDAYSQSTLSITFETFPKGALVTIDGNESGTTPLQVELAPGKHNITISLSGFVTQHRKYLIGRDEFIRTNMVPNENFTIVSGTQVINMVPNTNQFQILTESGDLFTLELTSGDMTYIEHWYNWLEDEQIRQELSIPLSSEGGIRSIAYQSPSGRYVYYIPDRSEGELVFNVYDTQINRQIEINFPAPHNVNPVTYFPRISWSTDESLLLLQGSGAYGCDRLLYLEESPIREIRCIAIQDETVLVNNFLSFPSEQGLMLVQSQETETTPSQVWILDIATNEASLLPFAEIYGATFNDDFTEIYVAHAEGISIIDAETFEEVSFVTDEISAQWGVISVGFTESLDYALVIALDDYSNSYHYLYRLPTAR